MIVEYSRMCTRGTLTHLLGSVLVRFLTLSLRSRTVLQDTTLGLGTLMSWGGCSPVSGFPFIWEEGDKAMSQLHE